MDKLLIEFIDTLDGSLKRALQEAGSQSGFARLTIHQFQYLGAIHELGEPTCSEVAARLGVTRASATAAINKLIRMGYVSKSQSSRDKRVFHVRLSESGEQLAASKTRALKQYGEFIRAALSPTEADQLQAILAKLVTHFQNT